MQPRLFLAIASLALFATGCSSAPADVYDMPMGEVSAKLSAVSVEGGTGAFLGDLPIRASHWGDRKVTWQGDNGMASFECDIGLEPFGEDAKATRISVNCGRSHAGEGAAMAMGNNLMRESVIEKIDSTLRDRKFDLQLAAVTAAQWPKDPTLGDTSLQGAGKRALEMQRDTEEAMQAMEDAGRRDLPADAQKAAADRAEESIDRLINR